MEFVLVNLENTLMTKNATCAYCILTIVLGLTSAAPGQIQYTPLTADGQSIRYLLDANDQGQMVGNVSNTATSSLDGFVRAPDGSASFWAVDQRSAFPLSINNAGEVVGVNTPDAGGLPEGYIRDTSGNETPFNFQEALGTVPFGISNDGLISGFYITPDGRRGFVDQSSTALSRSVEFPGSNETQLYAGNDRGQFGGAYYDSTGAAFPFIYDVVAHTFDLLAPPTTGNYVVTSVNNDGDAIVFGLRDVSESYADWRSFYYNADDQTTTELLFPGAMETYGYDIDDQGTIIGYYQNPDGSHGGFSAVVPEPSSVTILVCVAFIGLLSRRPTTWNKRFTEIW